jgi:signal transduction histidine kinase
MELGRTVGLANHTVLRNPDGTYTPIEDSAAPIRDREENLIGVVLVFRDATLERRTQAALRESEKLTSAARMSATVAHEINNPLEAVGNLLFLVKGTPGVPDEAMAHLTVAEQELDRVSHITKQTLGFAPIHELAFRVGSYAPRLKNELVFIQAYGNKALDLMLRHHSMAMARLQRSIQNNRFVALDVDAHSLAAIVHPILPIMPSLQTKLLQLSSVPDNVDLASAPNTHTLETTFVPTRWERR